MKKLLLVLSLIISGNLLCAKAGVIPDDDGRGFTLEFKGDEYYKEFNSTKKFLLTDFSDLYATIMNNNEWNNIDLWESGVYTDFAFCMDTNTHDFGFWTDKYMMTYSRFLINHYEGEALYVERLEIDWCDKTSTSGNKLLIYGSTSENPIYNGVKSIDAMNTKDNQFYIEEIQPDQSMSTQYYFDVPIRYLGIFGDGGLLFPQFSAFRIHFTEYDPTQQRQETTVVEAQLGDGSTVDAEWNRNGIEINTGIVLTDEILDISDLEFTLTPQFEITEKPDPDGEQPENWLDQEWAMYGILNENGKAYDGYIDSTDPIRINEVNYDEYGDLCLKVDVPCSGIYALSVKSANPDYEIKAEDQAVNVYAGINTTYADLLDKVGDQNNPMGEFGVNWVNFDVWGSSDNRQILHYPMDPNYDGKPNSPDLGIIYIPGLYNAEIYYRITFSDEIKEEAIERPIIIYSAAAADDGFILAENTAEPKKKPIDFSNLTESNPATMEIKVKKNGSETPMMSEGGLSEAHFQVMLVADTKFDDALKVEEVPAAEAEETVYYDLNGLRVERGNLRQGIYIRRAGGKTEKVVVL